MLPALATARAAQMASFSHGGSGFVPLYIRRLFHSPQMDLEFALYQMLWLCKSPKAVYVSGGDVRGRKNPVDVLLQAVHGC